MDRFNLFNKITENSKLVNFCTQVIGYNNILAFEESRKMFFNSLSVDHISNKDDLREVLDIIWFISDTLKYMILEEETIEETRNTFKVITDNMNTKFHKEMNEICCKGN